MKKNALLVGTLVIITILFGCSAQPAQSVSETVKEDSFVSESTTDTGTSSVIEDISEPVISKEEVSSKSSEQQSTTEKEEEPKAITLSIDEFKGLMSDLPISIVSTKYVVQDEKYKSLYPDMLQAVIQNNTDLDIKNAVVAFVAWDNNNLPIKLKGSIDFSDGSYIKIVNYSDINMIPGSTYGESSGFEIDDSLGINKFEAVCVSYEAFTGETWNNPYFDNWKELFEGKKYDDSMTIDIIPDDEPKDSNPSSTTSRQTESKSDDSNTFDENSLNAEIEKQDFKVISTKYVVQDERYKSLYPDMLQAVIKNDTQLDIKDAVVAFVAWDSNGLPIKLKGSIDFSDGAYIREVNYSDINLVPGATYGEKSGFEIDENLNINEFKAIVVSYESFDGTKWSNPLYSDWTKLYEGKKLK